MHRSFVIHRKWYEYAKSKPEKEGNHLVYLIVQYGICDKRFDEFEGQSLSNEDISFLEDVYETISKERGRYEKQHSNL